MYVPSDPAVLLETEPTAALTRVCDDAYTRLIPCSLVHDNKAGNDLHMHQYTTG